MEKSQITKMRWILSEDLPRILEIENLNHKFNDTIDIRRIRKKDIMDFIGDERSRVVVIEYGKIVNGFLMVSAKHDKKFIIKRLSIANKRLGHGSILLNQAEKFAQKAYAEKMLVYIYEQDDASIAFYKHNKFKGKIDKGYFNVSGTRFDAIEFSKVVKLNDEKIELITPDEIINEVK